MRSLLPPPGAPTRRGFIAALLGAGVAAVAAPAAIVAMTRGCGGHAAGRATPVHPAPRPGITAERVLAAADVPERSRAAYEAAREIPEVLDGLYCHCDCGERDRLRSLLSCFETRMPTSCGICRESAELALRVHREGGTLADVRAALDREFGD